ncbi:MAG TPA: hypothetical protein VEI57_01375 [Nitrospirota bacterium]|nr:hypothetical protein [Nitrospirota bacterium]
MSVLSVSNTANNPYLSTINTDFQKLQNDVQSYENAQNSGSSGTSGSSTQVTLSQQALNRALSQVQNKLASLTQQTQGAQVQHHHHHRHTMDDSGSSGSSTTSNITNGLLSTTGNGYVSQSQNSGSSINLSV